MLLSITSCTEYDYSYSYYKITSTGDTLEIPINIDSISTLNKTTRFYYKNRLVEITNLPIFI